VRVARAARRERLLTDPLIAMFEIPTLRARLAEALQVLAAVHTL
jgi:hypothetical protein